jgi:hypothetical protein
MGSKGWGISSADVGVFNNHQMEGVVYEVSKGWKRIQFQTFY